ncbi:hypothetical protein [Burkholderia sp. S171]|uniref:hypothetical protein n=1 Tax=Burkholderia sp. S171 TaxID=1641860 RepID=UPI00131C60AA|nr:hypothetical protein [Burkholderia sp. S171]
MAPYHVLICLPTHSEQVHINFAMSLMATTRALNDAGVTFETLHVASAHIIRTRNFFANYFVEHSTFTHVLFLDTDMGFPSQSILKMLAANMSIVGVAYPYRRFDMSRQINASDNGLSMSDWFEKHAQYTVSMKSDANGKSAISNGFVETEHIGTGILLVQRDVFEATKPFTICFVPPDQFAPMLPSGKFYGFFETIEDNGKYLSEDLSFCHRARQAGFSIWALIDQTIKHYGTSEVSGQYMKALHHQGRIP